ncbi:hypothetical protein [Nocardioides sp. TF02-7]|uniref:hypothetical protein n=1 Tax=Nocardioides sp. TF02-7 TaxID=2917724 RepID=UPI001F05BCD0|nr:hypothetical protein [Nocardioides sp. TF02-7]UMG93364.1 hypothetical protein MF408_03600 [Nocardioides sp. TF02-7]
MSDEQWLRERLRHAVPEPPAVPDRARAAERAARRRRRRTTGLVAAGAAAAVAAVAVLTTVVGGGEDGPEPAAGPSDAASDPAFPTDPATVPECPPAPSDLDDPLDLPDLAEPAAVPEGAVSARLCQGPGNPIGAPDDALVTDVGVLVEAVNDLAEGHHGEGFPCSADLGPGYRIVFRYADGSRFMVSGQLFGCRTVVVGSSTRTGADEPWDVFADLLRTQRAASEPPAAPVLDPEACTIATQPSPVAEVADLAVAALCIGEGRDARRADIAPAELEALLEDLEANTRRGGVLRCGVAPPFPRIVGETTWGDAILLRSDCGTAWFAVDDSAGLVWQPGRWAVALLDRLVTEAR